MFPVLSHVRLVRYLLLALFLIPAGFGLGGAGHVPLPGRTESLAQIRKSSVTTPVEPGPVKVIFSLPVTTRAVFLTIDDGWYPDQTVLGLMQKYHLPVTAFLNEGPVEEHTAYWRQFVQAGGRIEDHTYDHPFLTRIPAWKQYREIAAPLSYFSRFGLRPDELRPPYGDYNAGVKSAAQKAGIKYIVMWDAEVENGRLSTINNRPLEPGDIILLHWVPGLGREILGLLPVLARSHLGVADLTLALDGGSLTVVPVPALPPPGQPPGPSVVARVYQQGNK